jgi:hypothetical protein
MMMNDEQLDQFVAALRKSRDMSREEKDVLIAGLQQEKPYEKLRERFKNNPYALRIVERINSGEFLKNARLNPTEKPVRLPLTQPSKRNESTELRYLNISTDPKAKMIWRNEEKDRGQRFHGTSALLFLWLYLLQNKGTPTKKNVIREYISKNTHRTHEHSPIDLKKTLDNLKKKLKEVSGQPQRVISTWFQETEETITLKNLD